jgi:hypothetical protein
MLLPGLVVHICNPSILEVEAGGFQVEDQHGLHSETLSQKNNNKKNSCSFYIYKHRENTHRKWEMGDEALLCFAVTAAMTKLLVTMCSAP